MHDADNHDTNLTFVCGSIRDRRSPEVDLTSSIGLLCHSFSRHRNGVSVVESIWIPLPIAATCCSKNTCGKGKIEIYTCFWQ